MKIYCIYDYYGNSCFRFLYKENRDNLFETLPKNRGYEKYEIELSDNITKIYTIQDCYGNTCFNFLKEENRDEMFNTLPTNHGYEKIEVELDDELGGIK